MSLISRPLLATFAISVCCPAWSSANELNEVVQAIRTNEELYKDIEIVTSKTWQLQRPLYEGIEPPEEIIQKTNATVRFVAQGDKYFRRTDETHTTVSQKQIVQDRIAAFDGEKTRALQQNAVANVQEGRRDLEIFHSHSWLLKDARVKVPLSEYLTSTSHRKLQLSVTHEGQKQIDGLTCDVLQIERTAASGRRASNGILYLAPQRNYLPVRYEGYALNYSARLPISVTTAKDFYEIEPGIWFPRAMSIVVYDEVQLRRGKHVVAGTYEYTVQKCSLNPDYDINLFRDVSFNDGVVVYEVEDGKIVGGYVEGEPTESGFGPWGWTVIILLVLLLLAVAGFLIWRWRVAHS